MRERQKQSDIQIIPSWTGLSTYIICGQTVLKVAPSEEDGFRTPAPYTYLKTRDLKERSVKKRRSCLLGLAALLLSCSLLIRYATLRADNLSSMRRVSALETEYLDLKRKNDERLQSLTRDVDLNEIEKRAFRLGMRYPYSEQFTYYTPVRSQDYVTQLRRLP